MYIGGVNIMETISLENESDITVANKINSSVPKVHSTVSTSLQSVLAGARVPSASQEVTAEQAPLLGNYLDYRKYLEDFYQFKKNQTKNQLRPYNYAVFSSAADIRSPNYLKLIIEGKRNLSEDMILKFAKALSLNKEMTEEFKLLVLFAQASDPAERNKSLNDLNDYRVRAKIKSGEIDKKAFDKIPGWVTWILYAMIDQQDVEFKPERLKELLRSQATKEDIEEALKSLINSGEVVIDEVTGKLRKAHTLMESAEDIPVALVRKIQTELMYLGLESLFRDSPTEREFGMATLALTKTEFEDLRFQLRKFRKQVQKDISTARMSTKGERVYQMNLQLFPVTDKNYRK
jgi:uncharacterized protein (TIGR02147 family)